MELKPEDVMKVILAEDDFGHEMRVAKILSEASLSPQRAGTFTDPVVEQIEHGGTPVF
jgi:hypothetical protein